jgi:ribonuclease HII
MKYPTLNFEKKALADGYQLICGLDEAGRGSWAGPVVAAAVIFNPEIKRIQGITDSKLLTAKRRETLYEWIITHCECGVGIISEQIIDQINIYQATRQAMIEAIMKLKAKPDHLLLDAIRLPALNVKQTPLIKGDQKSWSIAAASIIAKVTRDRLMREYDIQFPDYGFAKHKGYGTPEHRRSLKLFGCSPIHRRSYAPVRLRLEASLV